jgi:ribosome-associated toxin RatA of RatAB toxin-antitoxin module
MRVPALAWLCMLLAWAADSCAADTRLDARRDGDAVLVEASAELRTPLKLAWEVLTAYDRYAEFVPDLRSSRTIQRDGSTAIVEQSGVAGWFLFRFPMEVRLSIVEEPYETVRCQSIAGNFRELSGVYRLKETAQGVQFLYSGKLVPDFRLPPLVGLPAVRASVERQFRGLVNEIERRAQREQVQ